MKLKSAISALAVLMLGQAFAASYTFNNGSGANASGIMDTQGRTFRNGTAVGDAFTGANGGISAGAGVVAVGVFSTDDLSGVTSSAQLLSLFTNFGDITSPFASAGPSGARSVIALSSPQIAITGNASFANENMYLFVGNGTTLANSTEFLIVKSNLTFNPADDESSTAIDIAFRPETSTVLFGSVVGDVKTSNADATTTAGWQLAVVPEPSAALLGLLGAVGLIRRRR